MAKQRKPNRQQTRVWQPLKRVEINPTLVKLAVDAGERNADRIEAWQNDTHQVIVRYLAAADNDPAKEMLWLSVKRHDRGAIRDFRQLQSIKNEIAGPEREACEVFPAESRLVDSANEWHLWVLPDGEKFPFGYPDRFVMSTDEVEAFNVEQRKVHPDAGKAKQRPWQPGLQTGLSMPEAKREGEQDE
jgi:hypothetical protein